MTDGIELLVRDHERLEALAKELFGADGTWADATHRVLAFELRHHLELEDDVLLAELEALGPIGVELAEDSRREHDALRDALTRLDGADDLRTATSELISVLHTYARREEGEVLPWFATNAGERARARFTEAIVERKEATAQDHTRTRLTAESNQPVDT